MKRGAGIHGLVAREHLHGRPQLRNLAQIAGKIAGGTFVVRNPVHDTVIMQVEEERFRQASFFSTTLAQECLRAQVEQERLGIMDEFAGAFITRCA